jgi:RNA polymerase sigma factor (TIGR02999 family)
MTDAAESEDTAGGTVTRLLASLDNGDPRALEAVFPLVYNELRAIAHRHRRRWNGDTTLGTTALVNEAYLRLVDSENVGARTRTHFLRVASQAMRQILCNYARGQRAAKRGGEQAQVSLDALGNDRSLASMAEAQSDTLADLDDALRRLEAEDPRLGKIVECRFFGGLSIEETAGALDVSPATVKRDWALARAWLFRDMHRT